MAAEPDSALVAAARAGDRGAFAVLVTRHYGSLTRICARVARDPELGADAAQEAVVRALLGLDRLRRDDRFGPWLLGIGLNVCRRVARDRVKMPRSIETVGPHDQPAADAPGPAELAEAAERASRVWDAIADLPRGQRDAVALFYVAGLTQPEIAEHLGTAVGAVKTRLHKARASLRPHLFDLEEAQFEMTSKPTRAVPMRITDVRRTGAADSPNARHILFLEDTDGVHRLPIWIGPAEANALAMLLEDVELPRPGPYQFAAALLGGAGAAVREVRISSLVEAVFYAQVILTNGATVDARPSDALALALVADVPISVDTDVLDAARRSEAVLPDLVEEALNAPDGARAMADETRTRLASQADEIDEIAARVRRAT